ncbi:MAG: hypothetical protein HY868_14410 [Chloroflexi bacterium]|nr:hypothetical protein [Chloroflexota bacterium]
MVDSILAVAGFVMGAGIVIATLLSAIRTFVVPRAEQTLLTRLVFLTTRVLFRVLLWRRETYEAKDRLMAYYAPVSLITLLPVWLSIVALGFTLMYWAVGVPTLYDAFVESGSSLLTLGYVPPQGLAQTILAYLEAMTGLILLSVLIAYLPTMYAAFSKREAAVTLLEVRAGVPPSAIEMIERYQRIHGLHRLAEMWRTWEVWFAEVEESHTSLPALNMFRSPVPNRSWVTAAGAVLDAASFTASTLDVPRDPQADLCIRAGFLALRRIADFYNFAYDPSPKPTDPISITRAEFDAACERLARQGVALKTDREQAWRDFAGWRVNYDTALLALCDLTMAPPAPWSSDRSQGRARMGLIEKQQRKAATAK